MCSRIPSRRVKMQVRGHLRWGCIIVNKQTQTGAKPEIKFTNGNQHKRREDDSEGWKGMGGELWEAKRPVQPLTWLIQHLCQWPIMHEYSQDEYKLIQVMWRSSFWYMIKKKARQTYNYQNTRYGTLTIQTTSESWLWTKLEIHKCITHNQFPNL